MSWLAEWFINWGLLEFLVIATIFGLIAAWFVSGVIAKRLGNAGKPGTCLVCGEPGAMRVPQIGLSFADRLFAPSSKPCEPKFGYDHGDSNRLCARHHAARALDLQTKLAQYAATTRRTSADSYTALLASSDASLLAMLPKSADATPEPTKVTQPSVPGAASAFGATP